MAIPGTQLWAEAILAACCKRDTTPISESGTLYRRPGPTGSPMPPYPAAVSRWNFHLMAAAAFLGIVDSPHKVSFEPRQGRIENGPCGSG